MQNELWVAGATALLAGATTVVLGDWLDHACRSSSTITERFLSGLLLLSCWTITLGSAGALSRPAAALPLLIVPILGAKSLAWNVRESIRHLRRLLSEADVTGRFLSGIISLSLAWTFLGALAPPSGMDALAYHLALPDQYLIRESIIPDDLGGYALFYQQFEMALAPLLALDRGGISANILVFEIFLTLVAGAHSVAKRISGPRAGLLAAAALATSPLAAILTVLTKNDLLAASFSIWSFHALISGPGSVRAGWFLGAAIAVKPTSAFAVAPMLCLALWQKTSGKRGIFSGAFLLFPLYWMLRNIHLTGSPFNSGAAVKTLVFLPPGEAFHFGLYEIRHFVESFFRHFAADGTDGPFGLLLFLLMAGLYFPYVRNGDSRIRSARQIGLLGLILWIAAGRGQTRFLLPLLAILGSVGAARITGGRRVIMAGLTAAILGLVMQVRIIDRENHFMKLHAGVITIEEYMEPWLNTYRLQKSAASALPEDAFIIAVGEAELFTLHRRNHYDGFWEPSRVLSMAHATHSPEQLKAILQERGYTHLLYNRTILQRLIAHRRVPAPACEKDFEVLHQMLSQCRIVASDTRADAFLHQISW